MEVTPVRDYDELITALKARVDEIGVAVKFLDDLAGVPDGFSGKVFGAARVKMVGIFHLFLYAEALAMRVELVPDLDAAKRMEKRWEQRDELRRRPGVVRKRFSPELRSKIMSEIGRIGGAVPKRFRKTADQRSRINRRNAKSGWRKRKSASINPQLSS